MSAWEKADGSTPDSAQPPTPSATATTDGCESQALQIDQQPGEASKGWSEDQRTWMPSPSLSMKKSSPASFSLPHASMSFLHWPFSPPPARPLGICSPLRRGLPAKATPYEKANLGAVTDDELAASAAGGELKNFAKRGRAEGRGARKRCGASGGRNMVASLEASAATGSQ